MRDFTKSVMGALIKFPHHLSRPMCLTKNAFLIVHLLVVLLEYTASRRMKILRENTYINKADLSNESINILGILALG